HLPWPARRKSQDHPRAQHELREAGSARQRDGRTTAVSGLRQRCGGTATYGYEPQQPRRPASGRGDLAGARPLFERALAVREKALGPEHPGTAESLNNLAVLPQAEGDLAGARPLFECALAIHKKVPRQIAISHASPQL